MIRVILKNKFISLLIFNILFIVISLFLLVFYINRSNSTNIKNNYDNDKIVLTDGTQLKINDPERIAYVFPGHYRYFNFIFLNGGYVVDSFNNIRNIPSILHIPSFYNGVPVTTINNSILYNISIEALVIPSTVKNINDNLNCEIGVDCKNLNTIIYLSQTPILLDALLSKVPFNCIIYVPQFSLAKYIELNETYKNSIKSIDELDDYMKNNISFHY